MVVGWEQRVARGRHTGRLQNRRPTDRSRVERSSSRTSDYMAMTKMAKSEGGVDVDRLLNFEHRSGIKDGEIETFITKVDAVNAAIQAMKARFD